MSSDGLNMIILGFGVSTAAVHAGDAGSNPT